MVRATLAAIRALGCTARYHNGEYRVNLPSPKGTEATAYYTSDADDAIATARHMAEQNPTVGKQLQREISNFRVYLLSAKFTGTEQHCGECGSQRLATIEPLDPDRKGCKDCGSGRIATERKDWISTADVLRWLDGLDSLLRS